MSTAEPFEIVKCRCGDPICNSWQLRIARSDGRLSHDDARRLKYSWDICRGLSVDYLERHSEEVGASIEAVAAIKQQRDDLLSALEQLMKAFEMLMPGVRHIAVQNYALLNDAPMQARAAIAKARGETQP